MKDVWGVMESMALKMREEQLVSSVLLRSHLVPAVQFQAPDFNRDDHKCLEKSAGDNKRTRVCLEMGV